MVDTISSLQTLQAEFADSQAPGSIVPGFVRNLLVSVANLFYQTEQAVYANQGLVGSNFAIQPGISSLQYLTLGPGTTTFTVGNVSVGAQYSYAVELFVQNNAVGNAVINWSGLNLQFPTFEGTGPQPTPTPNSITHFRLVSWNGGTIWWINVVAPPAPTAAGFNLATFGVHGDGSDEASKVQTALNACAAAGGGTVYSAPMRIFLGSSITIPQQVNFLGFNGTPGGIPNYPNNKFQLTLAPGATINVGVSAAIRGWYILNQTVFLCQSVRDCINLAQGYSGTGVTIAGTDASLENLLIVGFATGVLSLNYDRPKLVSVNCDCTVGFAITTTTTGGVISACSAKPYWTQAFWGAAGPQAITGITVSPAGLFRIAYTVAAGYTLVTGDVVTLFGVVGTGYGTNGLNSFPNGRWIVTVVSPGVVDLQGSNATGTVYTSGGNVFLLGVTRRSGMALDVQAGNGLLIDSFSSYAFDTAAYFGANATRCILTGFEVKHDALAYDPNTVGLWLDGTSSNIVLEGGAIADVAIAVKNTSTTTTSSHVITGLYLACSGAEFNLLIYLLSGRIIFGDVTAGPGALGNSTIYIGDGVSSVVFTGCDLDNTSFSFQTPGGNGVLSTIAVGNQNGPVLLSLPTADPHIVGALWSKAGAVTVSAG